MTSICSSETQYKLSYPDITNDTLPTNISLDAVKPPRLSYPGTAAISALDIHTQGICVSPRLKYSSETKLPSVSTTTTTHKRASSADLTNTDEIPRLGYPEYPITYQRIAYTAFGGTIYSSVGTFTVISPGIVKLTAIDNVTDIYADASTEAHGNSMSTNSNKNHQSGYSAPYPLLFTSIDLSSDITPRVCCPASFDSADFNDYVCNSFALEPHNDSVEHTFVDFVLFECNDTSPSENAY